jgi:outer membrane beta-barrel protein
MNCPSPIYKTIKIFIALTSLFSMIKSFATEKDLYDFLWLDPDKKVYVLQNKVHKKEKSVYVNLGIGLGLSSNFQDTNLIHSNAGYNINEDWAIELLYTKYSNKDNDALTNLSKINKTEPFIRKMKSNYGAIVKWSPFYGKVNTFNKIIYFDWTFGIGAGVLNTESNATTVADTTHAKVYSAEKYNAVIGKTEFSVHLSKNLHLGIGILTNFYNAPGPTISNQAGKSSLRNNIDSVLSIGVSF